MFVPPTASCIKVILICDYFSSVDFIWSIFGADRRSRERLWSYHDQECEYSIYFIATPKKSCMALASRHSPRYRKIATTTTTTITTTTTTFPFLLNLGLMDFDTNFWDGDAHVYVCPLERGCSVVSEARQVSLDSWKFSKLRWSSWKLIGLKTEELLIHSERFVDSWIEETLVWILVAFVHGYYHCKLEFWVVLTLEVRAGNLGPSTIAWCSYSVAMVSKSSYEIDRGKLHPKF